MASKSPESDLFLTHYWQFYKSLENDFLSVERYVTIDTDNFGTYSLEYNRLYQSICSEVDVVAKKLCELFEDTKANKITMYCQTITSHCENFVNEQVIVNKNKSIVLTPWDGWKYISKQEFSNPEWWTNYNKVKHVRQNICNDPDSKYYDKPFYKAATLENVINALAALYILNFYCMLVICKKNDSSVGGDDCNSIYNAMLPFFSEGLFSLPFWNSCCGSFIGEFVLRSAIEEKIKNYNINI